MNEQERAAKMLDAINKLEEEFGFDVVFDTYTDRVAIQDRNSRNYYEFINNDEL